MRVATIALYANPNSASHPRVSYDLEVSSPSQKSITGGLSCLFPIKSSTGAEELWHDEYASLVKRDNAHQITVSVLQCPSCSTTRIPHKRISAEFNSGSGSMLNGFVRYSCVYYASPPLALCVEDSNLLSENLMELELPVYAKDLLSDAQSRHSVFADDFVIKAFEEAEKAHRGQNRASGHPYLQHCVETALLLASIGANSTVVAAGLLHDAIDDSFVTYDHILKSFGAGVAELVQGVSKLSHLSKLARENNTANKTVEAARLHTIFLAMADARAVLIKLADRLHNMITLDALPLIKQPRFAKETSEIFVPLANRLGIFTWKEQLENLCFKHLNPYQHLELSSKLVKFFDEAVITYSVVKLDQALKGAAISYHCLSGRHKSLFSIHSKMLKKKLNMEEVHDIHGLRLIVESEEDCYKALKVVHQLWHEIPERFKDYIHNPKCNGYQSLHTVVSFDGVVHLEVQIRTNEMHLQAEYGFAAHWRYKESECKHSSSVVQMVEWARWVITWQCEAMSIFSDSMKPPCTFPTHSKDCRYSYKPEPGSDGPVFVIIIENDKMSVQELPANSSVMDLLGCTVKDSELKLNYEDVSDPRCKLKMGDVLELTPSISHKSLLQYRQEIQRMYGKGCNHIRCNK